MFLSQQAPLASTAVCYVLFAQKLDYDFSNSNHGVEMPSSVAPGQSDATFFAALSSEEYLPFVR